MLLASGKGMFMYMNRVFHTYMYANIYTVFKCIYIQYIYLYMHVQLVNVYMSSPLNVLYQLFMVQTAFLRVHYLGKYIFQML